MASSLSCATGKALGFFICGPSGSVKTSLRVGPIEEVGEGGAGKA